jgi:hypothetical protein
MAIRDDIRQSPQLRSGYNTEADMLAVIERAFGSRAFSKALSNILEDFADDIMHGVHREMNAVHKDGRMDSVRERIAKEKRKKEPTRDKPGPRRRGGSFVGSAAPKAKHMKSKVHVPRREAGLPDEHGRNIRHYDHLEDFDPKAVKQELDDLQEYLKELKITRKGEDYILLPQLRKELDRLSILEGGMAKGLMRKGLTGMPLGVGRVARSLYDFKDRRREAKRNKVRLDALIQANQKRMTQLHDAMLDSEAKRVGSSALEQSLEGTEIKVARDNQKLLKKILRQANPGEAEALDKIPIPEAVEQAAMSALPTLLKNLLGFLISPGFITMAGVALIGIMATEGMRRLVNKIADEREEEQKQKRDAKATELANRDSNKNVSKTDIQKAAQAQVMTQRANTGGDLRNGAMRDQLAPLKKKFMDTRSTELAKQGGIDAYGIHTQVEKEWKDYTTNPDGIANSPVARILDKDLRREAKVKPTPAAQVSRPAAGADQLDNFVQRGPGVDLDGLDPSVKSNLTNMAKEYFTMTGQKLPINSAHRSHEAQEALYKKDPGKAAKPGMSMHEYGYAIDTNSDAASVLSKNGLLQKYGFVRPVGKEAWHLESAAIQDQKQAIRENATPGAGSAPVSVAQTVPETEGAARGTSTPVSDASYERTPYETPGASAAKVAATGQTGDGMDGGNDIMKVSASSGGAQNLSTIPMVVDNLNLALYNTGAVR